MPTKLIYNSFRLLAGLILLAALLAGAPGHARAANATRCNASSAGMNRAPRLQDSTPNQAGLVIDFGGGRVMTFCIDLGADGQATGEELLRASNLPVILEYSGGIGSAVCKIDTVGSDFPAEPCFSHCTLRPGESCMYWSYSQLVGDHWQFSQVGASSTVVHSGDVNGWAWGESTVARGVQPPLRTLAEICLPATATPTATAPPTASPTPMPSATPPATQPPIAAPPATTTPYVAKIITATPTASPRPTSTPTAAPLIAPTATTIAPTPAAAPPALPKSSPSIPTPQPPAVPPSATPAPPTISAAPPTSSPANRSAGGATRIQLPLIQQAVVATPSATPAPPTASPTARVAAALTPPPSATFAPATPTPARPVAPADDPTRNYPYFGGMTVLLLAGWALLRRGRGRSAQ